MTDLTQLINKAIKVASCSFNLAISEMPGMVGQGLMGIVNKAVNTSSCLIENFVSNFVRRTRPIFFLILRI